MPSAAKAAFIFRHLHDYSRALTEGELSSRLYCVEAKGEIAK
jgi:hypothetical protein